MVKRKNNKKNQKKLNNFRKNFKNFLKKIQNFKKKSRKK